MTESATNNERPGHQDAIVLRQIVQSLWKRVRLLEMIVVRDADGEQTRNLMHGIRSSLYETGDYYSSNEPMDSFDQVFEKIKEKLGQAT